MADEILVKYKADTSELRAELKSTQEEFKKTETAGVESAKKTGTELTKSAQKAAELKEQLRQVQLGLKNATNPADVEKLTKAQSDLTTQIKKTETATVSLKSQLRSLKEQAAQATDPKEFARLTEEAGRLSDKINDTNESIKVLSTGSKLEQVGNAFGSIVTNVRNLDFERASEQAKVLLGIMKSLTFAEAVAGVKSLATAFIDLGKALLLNPVTAFAAAIAAVVYLVYDMTTAFQAFNTQSKTLNESLKASEDRIKSLGDKQAEYLVKLAQAQGKLTKSQADAKLNELKNFQDRTELARKFGEDVKKLADELELSLSDMRNGRFADDITDYSGDYKKLANQKKFNLEFIKLQNQFRQEQSFLLKTQVTEQALLNEETNKRIQDQVKANNEKIKQLNDEAIQEQIRLNKVLRDLRTGNIAVDTDREKQQLADRLADAIEQYKNNGAIIAELRIKQINDLNKIEEAQRLKEQQIDQEKIKASQNRIDAIQKQEDDFEQETRDRNQRMLEDGVRSMQQEVEARQRLQDQLGSTIVGLSKSVGSIISNINQGKIDNIEANAKSEQEILDRQYRMQLISKEDYEAKSNEISKTARAEETKLKRQTFETNRNIALIEAGINVAQGVTKALASAPPPGNFALAALVGVLGAAQIAAIIAQPTPKFEKGGKVGGKRHSQGGTLIEAEQDEWIIRRDMAIKNDRLLRAVNSGQGDAFIKVNYIAPALKEQQRKYSDSLSKQVQKEVAQFQDKRLLESMKTSRDLDRDNFKRLEKTIKGSVRSKHKW